MASRLELQKLLEMLLGNKNVYYQPPASLSISYPCVIYSRDRIDKDNADDTDTEKTKSVSKKKNTDLDKEVNPSKSLTKAKPSLNKSKAVKAERNARPIRTQIADTEINEDLF